LALPQSFELEFGGRKLIIETGKLATQSAASVTVRYGDTVVLVTLCIADKPREGVDFLPLTVDYEERLYAVGKIPGGFIRREGRPSQEATLACRLTDRPIRPLLPKTWRNDIQIVITVLSADQENDADILAVIGSSIVLTMSEIPFAGPVGTSRIGYLNGELVLNPTLVQLNESQFDIVVASTKDAVAMIEAGAKEAPEELITRAIRFGHEANQALIKLQEEIQRACGKTKAAVPEHIHNPDLETAVANAISGKVIPALSNADKIKREDALDAIKVDLISSLIEKYSEKDILYALDEEIKAEIRKSLLEKKQRISGRSLTEVRPISCEIGFMPRTHGSAVFNRGNTQVMTITTLGSTRKEQQLDGLGIEETKRFLHHYNMPPFANGEVGRLGNPGRREIGHGALAERSLLPVIPKDEDFPYTIRLVSEVLGSSGSTSMASVCASSLSLMDAGIPIKSAVAGVAMGLVTDDKGNYVILTDIEDLEDFNGDTDFKVAGTASGITGLQMDTKLKGLSLEIVENIIKQAKDGRMFILDKMAQTIASSRPELSRYAPRVYKITVPTEKIGAVIGPGGKTIRSITETTKTTVDIDDTGTVLIGSNDEASARKAISIIEGLTKEAQIGDIYTGKVSRILNFGAMIEILPGKEGLVHISELADYRVANVEDVVKVGDEITVKVVDIDNLGRVNLSRRAVLNPDYKPERQEKTNPSSDYPFKSQRDSRPPQGSRPPQNRQRH
jgi:polyribonucleotide nucleotidyltransferase